MLQKGSAKQSAVYVRVFLPKTRSLRDSVYLMYNVCLLCWVWMRLDDDDDGDVAVAAEGGGSCSNIYKEGFLFLAMLMLLYPL